MADVDDHLFAALADVYDKCSAPDWDGYNALPVTDQTCAQAERFLKTLPAACPAPSLGATPHGSITLEWFRERYWTLSVSITPNGELHYAALLGQDRACGTLANFDGLPQVLLDLIERIYAA